jgi:hypothetical protein
VGDLHPFWCRQRVEVTGELKIERFSTKIDHLRTLKGALSPCLINGNFLILITRNLPKKSGTKIALFITCFGVSLALEDPGATYKPLITIFSAPITLVGGFFSLFDPRLEVYYICLRKEETEND